MNLAGCQIQNTYLRDKQDGLLKPEAILLVSFQKNLHSVKPFLFQKKSELVFKKDSGIVKIPPRQSGKLNTLSEWRDFNMNIRILSTEQITAYDTYLRIEERAAGTREKYLRDVQAFVCWLNGAAVTKEAVTSWKERLLAEHRAPSTVNAALSALNGLFRFLGWEDCRTRFVRVQRRLFRAVSYTHLTLPTKA